MTQPLISADWEIALWATLVGIAGFGFWADTTRIGRRVSGVGIMLLVAMLLGNLGVIPHAAPVYDTVWEFLVPVAVPLLLLKANIRRVIDEAGPMLGAFFVGVTGTVVGAIIGLHILPLGAPGPDIAGILSATYIGGSMNFAAVAEALNFKESTLLTATLAADNVVGTIHLLIAVFLPSVAILRNWIPSRIADSSDSRMLKAADDNVAPILLRPLHVCIGLATSLCITGVGYAIANMLYLPNYGILFVTIITLVLANTYPNQFERLQGTFEIGIVMMFIFFATIGASADLSLMMEYGLLIFFYAFLIITVHLTVILVGAKVLRIDLAEVIVASLACIGGPVAPAAIAAAKGWRQLVTPGIAVGILGYAIANFVGVALAKVLT